MREQRTKVTISDQGMREIKFRAWDCFNAVFYYSHDYDNLAAFFAECQKYIDGGNELVFEQYIGLKDKNGVEIYEGDSINHGLFALNDTERFGDAPLPEGVNEDDITTILTNFKVQWNFRLLFDLKVMIEHNPDVEGVEIIGNIHENPELLGKKI